MFELFFGDCVHSEHTWIVHIAKIIDQNKRHCHLDFFAYLHANVVDMQTKQPDAIIAVTDSFFYLGFMYLRERKQWWIKKNTDREQTQRA